MRFIKRGINREVLLVIATSLLFTILNSLHVIIQWIFNPADRLFTGIAHYFADYFLYVAQMAQGAAGSWVWATHQFTNEPMPPTWIYWFNVAVGHLGSLVGLSPFATYNVALFVLCFMLLILWHTISSLIFPKNTSGRLLCFFLIVTATSFYNLPLLFQTKQLQLLGQFWFSPTTAFNRLGGVPHQIFQSILLLLLMVWYARSLSQIHSHSRTSILLRFFLTGALAFITATANPIQIVPLLLAFGITTALFIKQIKRNRLLVLGLLGFAGIGGLLGGVITTNHFKTIQVLGAARIWEIVRQVPMTLIEFLSSVGPVVLFLPFGIKKWVKNNSPLHRIFFFYGSLSLLFFASPIPHMLGTQRLRWIHPVPYALLPILASQGILEIAGYAHQHLHISKRSAYVLLLALYLFLTVPALISEVDARVSPQKNVLILAETDYNHVPQSTAAALFWLKQQKSTKETSVVLTDPKYSIEILVPVFTNKISFTGHPIHTLYPEYKEELKKQFFKGTMSPSEAKLFLQNHRIGYILAAPVIQNTALFASYPFLQTIFTNDRIMIERVKVE